MKTLLFQLEYQGEKFEIWQTECETLETAWQEIDERPEVGGWISFKGEK